MTKKETILIFTDWYVPAFKAGGPVQSIYNLSCLMSKHFIVKVVCRDRDLNSKQIYSNIQTNSWNEIDKDHFVMYLDINKTSFSIIKQLIKEYKSNIIYINGLYSLNFSIYPALIASYLNVKRVFISVRGMLHRSALSVKPLKKQIFLAFARGFGMYKKFTLLASNESEANEIRNTLGRQTVKVVPNIPMLPEQVDLSPKTFKTKSDLVSFLFLGRIAMEKNPLSVLKAIITINVPLKITFCGGGFEGDYMDTFIKLKNKLPDNIQCEIISEIPHHKISSLFADYDVMILPSLGENFGHAIFESLIHKTPVIIGNNTPWKDIQADNAGIIVDPGNIDSIKDAVLKFINMDSTDYNKMSEAAEMTAINYLRSNNFEEIYLKLFGV